MNDATPPTPDYSTILIATHNPGKLAEFRQLMHHLPAKVLGISDLPQDLQEKIIEPDEPFSTYQENALHKARLIAEIAGLPTLADDSGLEVDALPGELGVQSKRFYSGSDEERNQVLLTRLADVPLEKRTARFTCTIVLYHPDLAEHHTFVGVVEGSIATEPRGEAGFGFDPVFLPEGQAQSFGELSADQKNQVSHRARAIQACISWLETAFQNQLDSRNR